MSEHRDTKPSHTDMEEPAFNAGLVTISHFSNSPKGFEFDTKESLGRTEGIDDLHFDDRQGAELREAMKGEMQFNNVDSVTEARQAWRTAIRDGADPKEIAALKEKFEAARHHYHQKGKKIGLTAIELTAPNVLSADIRIVPFVVYDLFANPDSDESLLEFSTTANVVMALQTSDDRLIIQHRAVEKQKIGEPGKTRGNASYADTPAASVGGMVDASLSMGNGRKPGTPDAVDTDFLKENILKEAGEELGISPSDIGNLRIVGLARDPVKVHDEFLLLGESHLTAAELYEASRLSDLNKNLDDADFEEKFIDIENSPRAIETLLTEVKCPISSTHAAALVAAGYALVMRESGHEAAVAWKQHMEIAVSANYAEMDRIIAGFYTRFPEAAKQIPERYWGKRVPPRNLYRYTPAYTPEEQGFLSFEDEMVRTGLLLETRQHVSRGYLFDVDGVITNPREKKVSSDEMFDELIARLQNGEPVCFNTGRSTSWVMERVIVPMSERLEDKSLLQNVIIVGEKGGTWTTFDEIGTARNDAVETITIPEELKTRVRELIAEKYSDAMFFDESKETMLSVEMDDGYDITRFAERQQEFVNDIQLILDDIGVDGMYRIDPTTIATDIESPYVSKALGADRFLEFLRFREIVADSFVAFGDSYSDIDMAEELARRHKQVDFVYVGSDVNSLDARGHFGIHHVNGYNQGTLSYLSSHR